MKIETTARVSVDIDVPDCCEGKLSLDDVRSMVCNALGHNYMHQEVQLIQQDIAQSSPEGEEVMVDVWIDVDWDEIDAPWIGEGA